MKNFENESMEDDEMSTHILGDIMADDDGAAARGHLAAGRPITYRDPSFPDSIIREWPDGHRERIEVDDSGTIKILGAI